MTRGTPKTKIGVNTRGVRVTRRVLDAAHDRYAVIEGRGSNVEEAIW